MEEDFEVLEEWLRFEDFGYNHNYKGWRNVRFDLTRKTPATFYHATIRITSTLILRKAKQGQPDYWWAVFDSDIICLNPLSTVAFSENVDKFFNDDRKQQLKDYLRTLPFRLKKAGYPVDERLKKLCKEHIKKRTREQLDAGN